MLKCQFLCTDTFKFQLYNQYENLKKIARKNRGALNCVYYFAGADLEFSDKMLKLNVPIRLTFIGKFTILCQFLLAK